MIPARIKTGENVLENSHKNVNIASNTAYKSIKKLFKVPAKHPGPAFNEGSNPEGC